MATTHQRVTRVLLDNLRADSFSKAHRAAVINPGVKERPILTLLYAAADYIDGFQAMNDNPIAEDYLASEYLEPMLSAITNLLSYEHGRLDGGKLSEAVCYLRTCIDTDANPPGTQANAADLERFAFLANA